MRKTPILLKIPSFIHDSDTVVKQWLGKYANSNSQILTLNSEFESISIDMVRELQASMLYGVADSDTRIVVLHELEKSSTAAQNALLKTLEEPPENTQFIITSSKVQKLLPTIISRCLLETTDLQNVISENEFESTDQQDVFLVYQELKKADLAKKIAIAQRYKERAAAITFCSNLLTVLTQKLHGGNTSSGSLVQELQQLLVTQSLLKKNVNTNLALEAFFFKL